MLHAHSLLWHYLWVAPNLLLLVLGSLMWKRGLVRQVPAFFALAVLSAITELAIYAADVVPSVDPWTYWRMVWCGALIVALLKFVLISEIFAQVFGAYASISRMGRVAIRGVGIVLVFASAVLSAFAPSNSRFGIISGAQVLSQATYLIESGLLAFIFFFAFYFRLRWERRFFGITLGLSVSSCVHLATFALIANGGLSAYNRLLATFVNMAVYHLCVLIWFYYLLVPKKHPVNSAVPVPEHDIAVWNQELERLIHQ